MKVLKVWRNANDEPMASAVWIANRSHGYIWDVKDRVKVAEFDNLKELKLAMLTVDKTIEKLDKGYNTN